MRSKRAVRIIKRFTKKLIKEMKANFGEKIIILDPETSTFTEKPFDDVTIEGMIGVVHDVFCDVTRGGLDER